jgi:tetratricopeptide (TPR) repeat protein
MVACKQCSKSNSLDSLFCKHCGAGLDPLERSEAQQKVEDLIAEGFKIFNEGRTDESRLIAESTLAEQPDSTSALALKGMCHERAGELADALAAFERVVELNPDSALDRIKVQHLRQALAGKALAAPPSRKGRAALAAAAAAILVVAIGAAIAATQAPDGGRLAMRSSNEASAGTSAFTPADLNPATPQTVDTSAPAQPASSGGAPVQPPVQNAPERRPTSPNWAPPSTPSPRGGMLPEVGEALSGGIGPARVQMPTLSVRPEKPARDDGEGVDPKIERPGASQDPNPAPNKPDEDTGIIEIRVSAPKPSPGGSVSLDGNGAEALLKTANQQFLLGKHAQAAGSFEAALRAGAPAGSTNQRLAQCYANLGRKDEAIAAYRRAISSMEAALQQGGDNARTQSALAACRQALKVLGG